MTQRFSLTGLTVLLTECASDVEHVQHIRSRVRFAGLDRRQAHAEASAYVESFGTCLRLIALSRVRVEDTDGAAEDVAELVREARRLHYALTDLLNRFVVAP
jgi:hypothetical protein